jgi:exopolyphosphatase/guanosine-5'-triphosphate,3'-diphosphate pyrophosphatase
MWAPGARPASDLAVVDVGSNSVRLVLYRQEGRALWPVFNEKVLAGLGQGVAKTGRLSSEGVVQALAALRRFKAVLDGAKPDRIHAVATAAVRDAGDGQAFVDRILSETGLAVRILTGEEEARLSALGVVAGQPDAAGVVADLGGSSLELIRLDNGQPGPGFTLPLGPFALGAGGEFDPGAVRKTAQKRLSKLQLPAARTLYAVGGAWRNLGILHMRMTDYPLHIVHQYCLSAVEAHEAAHLIAHQSRASLERMGGMSKKRAETLPYAALVLEALIERLGVERVVLSAYGLREGVLFDAMDERLRALDPLIEGCAALGARLGASERIGPALERWLEPFWEALPPVFEETRGRIVLEAGCRLADIGARLHPDHRPDLAYEQVLRSPAAGQTHAERAFLAVAAYCRHTAQGLPPSTHELSRVLTIEQIERARAFGLAMRLGCDLSGRSPELLAASTLAVTPDTVVLSARNSHVDLLLGEQTGRRLAALGGALDRQTRMQAA